MARLVFPLLLLMLICNVNINASEISYNDIVVPTNYELTSRDFRYSNLNINGKDVSYDELNIIESTSNYIIANYIEDETTYTFKININRNDITDEINSVNEHSLEINDKGPLLNTSDVTCNVRSLTYENVNVNIDTTSNQAGITNGNISCESIYISTSRDIDVINVNEYSKYSTNDDQIIYVEDFGFDTNNAELSTLTDQQILQLANVDSNVSEVSVAEIGSDYVTFTDGEQSVTNSIYLDEAPRLKEESFYELDYESNEKLKDTLEISDDRDSINDLNVVTKEFNEPGIYESTVEITDTSYNTIEEDALVVVNDGRYYISDDDKYIVNNEPKEIKLGEDVLQLEVYDIENKMYKNVDSKIVEKIEENDDQVNTENSKNHYSQIVELDNVNYSFVTYILMFLIIIGLTKFL